MVESMTSRLALAELRDLTPVDGDPVVASRRERVAQLEAEAADAKAELLTAEQLAAAEEGQSAELLARGRPVDEGARVVVQRRVELALSRVRVLGLALTSARPLVDEAVAAARTQRLERLLSAQRVAASDLAAALQPVIDANGRLRAIEREAARLLSGRTDGVRPLAWLDLVRRPGEHCRLDAWLDLARQVGVTFLRPIAPAIETEDPKAAELELLAERASRAFSARPFGLGASRGDELPEPIECAIARRNRGDADTVPSKPASGFIRRLLGGCPKEAENA